MTCIDGSRVASKSMLGERDIQRGTEYNDATRAKEYAVATQSLIQSRLVARPVARPRVAFKLHLNIRTDFLVIRLLLVVGFLIPALMVWHVIPASLPLVFIALGLLGAAGIGWLIRCGEIA